MSKTDFPALRMTIDGGRLVPAGPFDAERLNSYRRGTVVYVRFTEEKDRVLVRKWFAIIGLVLKQCQTPWKNKDEAHEAIKLALGIVNLSKTVGGDFMAYPKSLAELEDPELQEALEQMTELLSHMTGVDVATLRKETAHIDEVPHDPSTGEIIEGEILPPETTESDAPPSASGTADVSPASAEEAEPPPSPGSASPLTPHGWLVAVARMLFAATNYGGDIAVLKAQKTAAMASYEVPADEAIRAKANGVFGYCSQVVLKEMSKADGLAMVAGVVGCDQDEIGRA